MNAQAIVAVILALCVMIYLWTFPVMRWVLPPDLVPQDGLMKFYEEMGREVVVAIVAALSVYIGVKVGK